MSASESDEPILNPLEEAVRINDATHVSYALELVPGNRSLVQFPVQEKRENNQRMNFYSSMHLDWTHNHGRKIAPVEWIENAIQITFPLNFTLRRTWKIPGTVVSEILEELQLPSFPRNPNREAMKSFNFGSLRVTYFKRKKIFYITHLDCKIPNNGADIPEEKLYVDWPYAEQVGYNRRITDNRVEKLLEPIRESIKRVKKHHRTIKRLATQ